ncbi:MAG TPA: hypothetical protein PLJ60_05125 [Chryseolinea sp.]|nr:hypothetical protein [Chryseolinea sp.]HPM29701.1 hypothetical protein [Chryseolinea sp.]
MKTIFSIAFLTVLTILFSCTKNTSRETTHQDTIPEIIVSAPENVVSVDSTVAEEVKPELALIISDSTANALSTFVDAKFDTLYQALADTSNYYKAILEDYFDEYEGQDQKKIIESYFNKKLMLVYIKYTFESGSLDQPEITEYILTDEKISSVKNESEFYGPDNGRTFTKWNVQLGGVKLNWSEYWKEVKSLDPVPDGYAAKIQDECDSHLSLLKSTLDEEENFTGDENIYTISIRVPKRAELVDYTEVTIPKAVYHKLKQ